MGDCCKSQVVVLDKGSLWSHFPYVVENAMKNQKVLPKLSSSLKSDYFRGKSFDLKLVQISTSWCPCSENGKTVSPVEQMTVVYCRVLMILNMFTGRGRRE